MQKIKTKESKYITKESQLIMKEVSKEESERELQNNHKTSNKMAKNTYLSVITLNINVLNAQSKRHSKMKWIKKKRCIYMQPTKDSFQT